MKIFFELILGSLILGIVVLFLNPTHLLMPETMDMMLSLGLIVSFLVFIGMFWREKAGDERDAVHIQKSGRLSFFVGTTILILGIIMQTLMHKVDPWLLFILSGMVLAKLIARIYHHFKS